MVMDEGEEKPILVTGTLSCESCGKSFNSLKALGGHMRIHRSKTNRSSVESGANADDLETKPICSVCGRDFRSMKSLFGHMRCHPERDYRGIKAPADKKISATGSSCSSSSLDEICNNSFDLMKESMMLSWQVRGKRGRKQTSTAMITSEEDEKKLIDAVDALLALAQCHSFYVSEVTNSNSQTNKQGAASDHDHEGKLDVGRPEIGSKSSMKRKKQKRKMDQELNDDDNNINISPNKKKKRMKIHVINTGDSMELTPAAADYHDQKYFKCSDCNKRFSTHQALGGHKSSHNKQMIKSQNQTNATTPTATVTPTATAGDIMVTGGDLTGKMQLVETCSTNSSSPHQCKTCNRIFPSGQALGGHMRRHYIGNLSTDSSSQANSPGETSQTGRIIHGFDLNQLPATDQDELA